MAKVKNRVIIENNGNDNIVYGIHAVCALLLKSPQKIRLLSLQETRHDDRLREIIQLAQKHQIPLEKTSRVFDQFPHAQGVIAYCIASKNMQLSLEELLVSLQSPPLLLILDGVQDPHNLGACLRSANAAGADAVIIPKDRAAPLNATVRKVACGASEFTPVITVTNLAQTLRFLKDQGIWIYGLAGEASSSLYSESFVHPTALVLGAEEEGLRRLTREHCDVLLSIPMHGEIESLNVSVAAGICLFEAARQRTLSIKAKNSH
jgi:23S rRNA (guanosine2251-2'-O)-methyltransferase